MSNAIEDRLAELKRNLAVAETNPDDNMLYIQDLKDSIKHCEREAAKVKRYA